MGTAVIAGNDPIYCGADVRHWMDTGLGFGPRRPRKSTRAVVLHWTGGTGDAKQVHATLRKRRLSVHFIVDEQGVVWQCMDADAIGAHAGGAKATLSANPWSVGIEIVCPGNRRAEGWTMDFERIHGVEVAVSQYRPAQAIAARQLCRALCDAYRVPFIYPEHAKAMSRNELSQWRGLLGHLHVTPQKLDPGSRILSQIVRGA